MNFGGHSSTPNKYSSITQHPLTHTITTQCNYESCVIATASELELLHYPKKILCPNLVALLPHPPEPGNHGGIFYFSRFAFSGHSLHAGRLQNGKTMQKFLKMLNIELPCE